ncbi:MAG TPA: M48 family metallopeptidase, partial [Holophaga sp.]|nr:M48 family metallopeptidase [Holophaga sp.]
MAHADAVPEAFRETVDEATYARSVRYALARSRFSQVEDTWGAVVLAACLFTGVLPWALGVFRSRLGDSPWSMAAFLLATGLALALPSQPLEWLEQFRLEERFGFNTTSQGLWWMDRLKGCLLAVLLGYPVLALILALVSWTGTAWWFWAWAALLAFQLLVAVLAPVLILPLFNKFTPLPEGGLRDRLLALAARTSFQARGIQVMDGSRRSRHSNAFFTGFGRFRRIVLFDTLVQQLTEPELEAVLAHEIGHFKERHVPKRLAVSALLSFAGFGVVAFLADQSWFYRAFGFEPGLLAPALLLFGLLSGLATFWTSPLSNGWSRRHEYQADAYAARAVGSPDPLIQALRKLNERN